MRSITLRESDPRKLNYDAEEIDTTSVAGS